MPEELLARVRPTLWTTGFDEGYLLLLREDAGGQSANQRWNEQQE